MSAYQNFTDALDQQSPETKRTYLESFRLWLKFNNAKDADTLELHDPPSIQQKIKDFMQDLRENNTSYSTANKAFWAVRKFYAANQVMINWDWVELFKPKRGPSEQDDRPYTKHEVLISINKADHLKDLRSKAAIMIMATGGVRIGALPDIRVRDLEYLSNHNLYCLTIYPLDMEAKYRTFVTPDTSEVIRKLIGKKQDKDYLFTNKRESSISIKKAAIQADIWRILQKVGLREVTSMLDRKEVQLAHGFRKFATTTWQRVGLDVELRQLLDGQNPGVQKRYAKLTASELFEASRYGQAIEELTF